MNAGDEDDDKKTDAKLPILASVGACAALAIVGTVYMKRRNNKKTSKKDSSAIFTVDKNSAL